ncbi:hypothetical protein M758_1G286500 [Ceratodon purpureus]|nr:hypothetical protein M758_1G286500 [Ceratodon purpureus]
MRRHSRCFHNLIESAREGNAGRVSGNGWRPWSEGFGMAPGWRHRCLGFLFLSLFVFVFMNCAATDEASVAGVEMPGLGLRHASPCDSAAEAWPRGHLKQRIVSEEPGPSVRQIEKPVSCPVKCFRADPVCGTDKVTYWCGVADAKCAGVEVAHDGYCNLWELDTNVGSTTALRAAQSLQLVHILWLVVAGLLIVLGLV